jgi:hypothetical protein
VVDVTACVAQEIPENHSCLVTHLSSLEQCAVSRSAWIRLLGLNESVKFFTDTNLDSASFPTSLCNETDIRSLIIVDAKLNSEKYIKIIIHRIFMYYYQSVAYCP